MPSFLNLFRNVRFKFTAKAMTIGVLLPGTFKVRDTAILYRMKAGSPGDLNRAHNFSTEDCLCDPTNPPGLYGSVVVGNPASQGVRSFQVGDTPASIWGITVRPYPTQQTTGGMSAAFGVAVSPASGVAQSVLRLGYILMTCYGTVQPTKFGAVYVYTLASNGNHVLGGFEAAPGTGLTLVPQAIWNGPTDANGVTEIIWNV